MPEPLGLSEVDDLAYRALLRTPGMTAAQLAADLGRPVGQATEALASLAAAGLAVPLHQPTNQPPDAPHSSRPPSPQDHRRAPARAPNTAAPIRTSDAYQAVVPDLAFGRQLDQREQDLLKDRAHLRQLMEVFRDSSTAAHPEELVELVSGPEAIDTRIRQLFDSARSQIRAFDRPPYPPPHLQAQGPTLDYESRRPREGITYRVVYSRDALTWPGRFRTGADIATIAGGFPSGEKARVRTTLPTKLMLADTHAALIPVNMMDTSADLAYAIRAPALLAALSALFESEWERGTPLSTANTPNEPDETSRALLHLLAAGMTDTAIARELDWSPRTTQRRVKDLFDHLGVATRFQAGVVARDRGWL